MLVLVIDGLNLVRRIYAAVPGEQESVSHQDDVLRSVARSAQRAIDSLSPTHALVVFDSPGNTWRHELLPDYKKNRPPMPPALAKLLPRIEMTFKDRGIFCVTVPGFEADDIVATIATKVATRSGQVVVLSTDKSMLSLLRDGVRVRNHFENIELDAAYTRERFGVNPNQISEFLALIGDRSQNIPGVKSIGKKTAAKLLNDHGSLHEALAAANEMPGRLGETLLTGTEDALLSLQVVTLKTDVVVGINLGDCRFTAKPVDRSKAQ